MSRPHSIPTRPLTTPECAVLVCACLTTPALLWLTTGAWQFGISTAVLGLWLAMRVTVLFVTCGENDVQRTANGADGKIRNDGAESHQTPPQRPQNGADDPVDFAATPCGEYQPMTHPTPTPAIAWEFDDAAEALARDVIAHWLIGQEDDGDPDMDRHRGADADSILARLASEGIAVRRAWLPVTWIYDPSPQVWGYAPPADGLPAVVGLCRCEVGRVWRVQGRVCTHWTAYREGEVAPRVPELP